jgi:hypothetical protein
MIWDIYGLSMGYLWDNYGTTLNKCKGNEEGKGINPRKLK